MKIAIFWFRRDLRLDDNAALYSALKSNNLVLPIFIFDQNILTQLEKNDARVNFIHICLKKIQDELSKINKSLAIFYGDPIEIFKRLINENTVECVYTNHDYEPYARKRDIEVYQFLKRNNVDFKTAKDQVIFEKSEIVKADGSPYVVFTPYANQWKQKLQSTQISIYNSEDYLKNIINHNYKFLSLQDRHWFSRVKMYCS